MSVSPQPEIAPKLRRVVPVHPILFAAFPVLALYARNLAEAPPQQIAWWLAMVLSGTAVLWTIVGVTTRSVRKGAAAASLVVLPLLSYSHLENLVPLSYQWIVGASYVVFLPILFAAIVMTRKPLWDMTSVLNLASVVLLAPTVWGIGVAVWHGVRSGHRVGERVGRLAQSEAQASTSQHRTRRVLKRIPAGSEDRPDVYYIILDAYGRSDSLHTYYGYDNTSFLNELKKRGFYIAARSRANYNQTPLCVASSLNFDYLDDIARTTGEEATLEECSDRIDDNEAALYLSRLGYQFVFIGSGVGQVAADSADLKLNNEPDLPLFQDAARNLLPVPVHAPEQRKRYDQHRNRLLGVFNNLNSVAQLPYPKFVFAHVLAPHPPFVLGPHGEPLYPKGALSFADGSWLIGTITRQQYIEGYIGQLQFINKRTLEAVDSILKQSRRTPIIIIQGDHGSRMDLDWESLEHTELRETFSILNAYLVPDNVRKDLYETITPVNTFRIILDDAFGAKYPRRPDRSFYSTVGEPFAFVDVTSRIPAKSSAVHSQPAPPRNRGVPTGSAQ